MKFNNRSTKGKVLYACNDCGERHYIRTMELNRRNGDRCMGCGGRMIATSNNAIKREQVAGDMFSDDSIVRVGKDGKRII